MKFVIRFPSLLSEISTQGLQEWLKERGEPCDLTEDGRVALQAMPLVFTLEETQWKAEAKVEPSVPLSRLVDLLFATSMHLGSDVLLDAVGPVGRPDLWLLWADEQDRQRLARSLVVARDTGNSNEILKRLWSVIHTLRKGRDDRWDASWERIVEVVPVGDEGMNLSDARRLQPDVEEGGELAVPVGGYLHTLAWRWFSESYPSMAESWESP